MGSLAIAFLHSTPQITMKSALLVLAFAAYVQAGQWIYVEDPYGAPPAVYEQPAQHRFRRSPQDELAQGAPLRYAPAPLATSYDQYEALLRLIPKPTSNGEFVMSLEFNTENRPPCQEKIINPTDENVVLKYGAKNLSCVQL